MADVWARLMQIRILLVIVVAPLVWWFSYRLVRPDDANWILWLMSPAGSDFGRVFWGLICFAGIVVIVGSLVLFYRRTRVGFFAVAAFSYAVAAIIGVGFKASGDTMSVQTVMTLTLGMLASVPITFADMVAGKQIDIVGDGA